MSTANAIGFRLIIHWTQLQLTSLYVCLLFMDSSIERSSIHVRERERDSSICSHPAQFVVPFALHSQFAHFPHSKTLTRTQSIYHSMFTLGRYLRQIEFRVRIRIQLQIKKMRKLQKKKKKRRKARNGYHYQQAVVNVLNLNFGREFSANCANCLSLFGAARKSAMKF